MPLDWPLHEGSSPAHQGHRDWTFLDFHLHMVRIRDADLLSHLELKNTDTYHWLPESKGSEIDEEDGFSIEERFLSRSRYATCELKRLSIYFRRES